MATSKKTTEKTTTEKKQAVPQAAAPVPAAKVPTPKELIGSHDIAKSISDVHEQRLNQIKANPPIGSPVQYIATDGNVYPAMVTGHNADTGYTSLVYFNDTTGAQHATCLHVDSPNRDKAAHSGWQLIQ